MRKPTLVFLALTATLLLTGPSAHAAGQVDVQWLAPEKFSDAGRNEMDRAATLQSLTQHLQSLGRYLPDGQLLHIEVSDLDLAGELLPLGTQDLRVLRGGADWPRMSLSYRLESQGRTLSKGQIHLSDMGYMRFMGFNAGGKAGELAYEKRMLERWIRSEFGAR